MTAYRPAFVKQLDGSPLAGLNCTCACGAMALDRDTLGAKRTSSALVRSLTKDTTGGTTQVQVATAIWNGYGVNLEVRTPIPVQDAFAKIDAGCGMMLAGQLNTKGTIWQTSETFTGNHQWYVNERVKRSNGVWYYLVFDPLGDARRAGIAQSPFWVPQSIIYDFAKRLNISSHPDTSYVPLGTGRFYAVFTRDTEPHAKYAADVPAAVRALDPDGGRMGAAINKAGHKYGAEINISDIGAALKLIGHNYGAVVDPSDAAVLLAWAAKH